MKFRCPNCQQKIQMADEHAGRRIKCPACAQVLAVPGTRPAGPPRDSSAMLSLLEGMEGAAAGPDPQPAAGPRPARGKAPPATTGPPVRWPAAEWTGLGVLLALLLLALIFGNWITRAFALFVVLATVNGWWLGASKVAAALGGLLVATILAVPLGRAFEGLFASILGTGGLANRMISVAVIAVLLVAAATAALHIPVRRLVEQHPDWRRYDRLAGSGIGLLEGCMLGMLMLWAVLSLAPMAALSVAASEESGAEPNAAARLINDAADAARDSMIGRLADAANPLSGMRLIALFRKALLMLNDVTAREAFVTDEAMVGIRDRPSVRKAMDMFAADTALMETINAEHGLSRESLQAVMNSQTVLDVLDKTGLVDELTPLADELERAIDRALAHAGLKDEAGEDGKDAPTQEVGGE